MTALPTGYDADGAELDALVDQVLGTRPRPIDWARLEEPDLSEQWEALETWVRWLVTRYGLDHREIPPCWQEHGDLLEELSALHTAHHATYLALAEALEAPLYTSDAKLLSSGHRARVHVLNRTR